jgi:hypothetical protein
MKGHLTILNGMCVEDSDVSLFSGRYLAYSLLERMGKLLSILVNRSTERKLYRYSKISLLFLLEHLVECLHS